MDVKFKEILSDWIDVKDENNQYSTFIHKLNIFLREFYFTETRRYKYDDWHGFLNFIKYFYVKNSNIFLFYYTGEINILIKCDLKNIDKYDINEILYIQINDLENLSDIILNLGLWNKSNRNIIINDLLEEEFISNYKFNKFIDLYKEHLITRRQVSEEDIQDWLKFYELI